MIILRPLLTRSATTNFRYYNVCTIFSGFLHTHGWREFRYFYTCSSSSDLGICWPRFLLYLPKNKQQKWDFEHQVLTLKTLPPLSLWFLLPSETPHLRFAFIQINMLIIHIPKTSFGFLVTLGTAHSSQPQSHKLYARASKIHLNTTAGQTWEIL